MRTRLFALIGAILFSVFGALMTTSGANAAPATQHLPSHVTVQHGPDGAVTYREKAPGGKGTLTYGWRPTSSPAPKSAWGCNGDVCINIIGDSTTVDEWDTYLFGNVGCTYAHFHINDVVYLTSTEICPDSEDEGVYWAYWLPYDVTFYDGDMVCNSWDNGDGYPCEEIEQ